MEERISTSRIYVSLCLLAYQLPHEVNLRFQQVKDRKAYHTHFATSSYTVPSDAMRLLERYERRTSLVHIVPLRHA